MLLPAGRGWFTYMRAVGDVEGKVAIPWSASMRSRGGRHLLPGEVEGTSGPNCWQKALPFYVEVSHDPRRTC